MLLKSVPYPVVLQSKNQSDDSNEFPVSGVAPFLYFIMKQIHSDAVEQRKLRTLVPTLRIEISPRV